MNAGPSAQIFERPKRSWLAQRKIWGQLQHAARAVHSPLAGLAFREPSSRRAFAFGIAGTLGALGLLMYLSPSLGAKSKPVPKLPSIKLSTQLALPKPPPAVQDKPKLAPDNPAAQDKPKLAQDKPAAQDKPGLAQDKPRKPAQDKKLAESSRPSSNRRRKPPKATSPKRPPQELPSPPPNLPEKTLDFSGQAAGMIQSSAGASAAGSGGMVGPGAAGGSGSRSGSGSGSGRSGKSLAQRAKVASASAWNCAWPDAAIDRASNQERVLVEIKVDRRGKMIGGKVLESPGYGFGQEALDCAKRQRYTPAIDAKGRPVFGGRLKLRVRFKRNG